MTPLEFAEQLAKELDALTLPDPVYAQLGDIIVDCAGTTVSVMTVSEQELTTGGVVCDIVQMSDIIVIAARECSNVSNNDGTTNHPAMDGVAATMDADGAILLEWANEKMVDAFFRLGLPSLTFTIEGAIAFVTLAVTLPIP